MLEILIQSKNKEKDIALVENGNLIEYYKENSNIERNEGNIYVGIIKDVVEGMQAAFVDIGTDKNSFIHIKDMLPKIDETVRKYDNNTNIKDIVQKGKKILVLWPECGNIIQVDRHIWFQWLPEWHHSPTDDLTYA